MSGMRQQMTRVIWQQWEVSPALEWFWTWITRVELSKDHLSSIYRLSLAVIPFHHAQPCTRPCMSLSFHIRCSHLYRYHQYGVGLHWDQHILTCQMSVCCACYGSSLEYKWSLACKTSSASVWIGCRPSRPDRDLLKHASDVTLVSPSRPVLEPLLMSKDLHAHTLDSRRPGLPPTTLHPNQQPILPALIQIPQSAISPTKHRNTLDPGRRSQVPKIH